MNIQSHYNSSFTLSPLGSCPPFVFCAEFQNSVAETVIFFLSSVTRGLFVSRETSANVCERLEQHCETGACPRVHSAYRHDLLCSAAALRGTKLRISVRKGCFFCFFYGLKGVNHSGVLTENGQTQKQPFVKNVRVHTCSTISHFYNKGLVLKC